MTRDMMCPKCGHRSTRTRIGLKEPSTACYFCDGEMEILPSFPAGVHFKGEGFHSVDYPKSAAQKIKDYGLDRHDSTNDRSDYNEEGYDGS